MSEPVQDGFLGDHTRIIHCFFPLGRIVATRGLVATGIDIHPLLQRHASGDWGDICPGDEGLNDNALQDGDRLMSVYKDAGLGAGGEAITVWIITEADRSSTTCLLPEDY